MNLIKPKFIKYGMLIGKSINVIELNSESFYVNLEDFSEGFYIFKIQSHSSGVNTSFKILKN